MPTQQLFFVQCVTALSCIVSLVIMPLQQTLAHSSIKEYYLYDRQGSLLEVYESGQRRILSQTWSPWGERSVLYAPWLPSDSLSPRKSEVNSKTLLSYGLPAHMGYAGHKELIASSLVHVNDTRLYNASLKRFLNPNNRVAGGVRKENRYSFAYNNSLDYTYLDGYDEPVWTMGRVHAEAHRGCLSCRAGLEGLLRYGGHPLSATTELEMPAKASTGASSMLAAAGSSTVAHTVALAAVLPFTADGRFPFSVKTKGRVPQKPIGGQTITAYIGKLLGVTIDTVPGVGGVLADQVFAASFNDVFVLGGMAMTTDSSTVKTPHYSDSVAEHIMGKTTPANTWSANDVRFPSLIGKGTTLRSDRSAYNGFYGLGF